MSVRGGEKKEEGQYMERRSKNRGREISRREKRWRVKREETMEEREAK